MDGNVRFLRKKYAIEIVLRENVVNKKVEYLVESL